jgi:hypothetical protein
MNTYEMIRALPGKGFDWPGFYAAMRAAYVENCATHKRCALGLDRHDAAKGVRQLRQAAWEMAGCIVQHDSVRARFIGPSPETLSWGGFLGGETVVVTDHDAEEQSTFAIGEIIKRFR